MVPDWHDHIVSVPGLLSGKPAIKGTRLSVEFVLELLAGGWDEASLRDNYPNLSQDAIRAVQSYAVSSAGDSTG